MKIFEIGNTVNFEYAGKIRCVKIEKVKRVSSLLYTDKAVLITGWDYLADLPTGGYRSFNVEKIVNPQKVG